MKPLPFFSSLLLLMLCACSTPSQQPSTDMAQFAPNPQNPNRADDVPPRILHKVWPTYPESIRGDRIEGTVVVGFYVTSQGDVVAPSVISSPHPLLSEAALAAIRQWKFAPGLREGKPVNCKLTQTMTFSLDQ